MKIEDYQKEAKSTAIYEESLREIVSDYDHLTLLNVSYVLLGLSGEVGEIQNKFKKVLRGDKELGEFIGEAIGEIGDVMWYVAMLCNELNLDLSSVIEINNRKLSSRKDRGVLMGDGDYR